MLDLYENRHLNERAIIICNGPSLNDMDLSFLKNEICIGLNKIYLGFNKFNFYPKYYVAVNEKVLRQSEQEIKSLTSVKFLSNRCPDLFQNNALTHVINTKKPHCRFSKNISMGLDEGGTVTYAALQVAYFMGFSEVIIIGMDHRFDFQGEPNESKFLAGKDINHFCSSYFQNKDWDNPDIEHSEESYQIAKQMFENSGRKIFDATQDGACSIFDKVDYREKFLANKTSNSSTQYQPNNSPESKVQDKEKGSKMVVKDESLTISNIKLLFNVNDQGGTHYRGRQHVEEAVSPLFDLLKNKFQPSVVVDIGANYGFTASVFYHRLSPEKIVAVEPDPALLSYLVRNIESNVGVQCETIIKNCFVGEKNEQNMPFGINPKASQDNRVKPLPGWETKLVNSITLNKLLVENANEQTVFIKIDTQGYDPVVIRSGEHFLCNNRNWIIRSEFAPHWMESQQQDPVEFLCYATKHYDVYEAPARTPFYAHLKDVFSSKIPNQKESIQQFVDYVQSLNHKKLGWIDIFLFPKNTVFTD